MEILLIILLIPIIILYFVIKYLMKFYKSNHFSTKQKIIYTIVCLGLFSLIAGMIKMTKAPDIERVEISDITLYKGSSKNINMKVTPKKSTVEETDYTDYDTSIISIDDDEIKAENAGETTVVCEVTDSNNKTVKSNKFKVTVKLTDQQIAEEKRKAEEEAAKAEQKLQEKRNKLSASESFRIRDKCKDIINQLLKAPSTAKYPDTLFHPFKDWNMAKKNNLVTVSSYVDAENSFGAKLRTSFIIQFKMNDDGSGTVSYVKLGNRVITGTFDNSAN